MPIIGYTILEINIFNGQEIDKTMVSGREGER